MGKHRESITHNWERPPLEPPRPPRAVLSIVPELLHRSLELDAEDHRSEEDRAKS